MRITLLLFFGLLASFGFAQEKHFEILWNGTVVLETAYSTITVPSFDKDHFSFDVHTGLKFFSQWSSEGTINKNSVAITNVSYTVISADELKSIPLETIPTAPKLHFENTTARDKTYAYLEVSPIVKDNGVYKKITSFSITYNTSANRAGNTRGVQDRVSNSVLNSGTWYRFYVDRSGVFKLTKSFLNSLGLNTNAVDPRTVKIYGNGGAMLPLPNSKPYPLDLTENAIQFIGEEDGEFNNTDYILFYAEGPVDYNQDSNTNYNVFTDKSYYYINVSGSLGKRIQPLQQPEAASTYLVNTFQDYQFHEVDEVNIVRVGRRWFGDKFDVEHEKEFVFNFPNLITTESAHVKVYAASTAEVSTSMEIKINGNVMSTFRFTPIGTSILADGKTFDNKVSLSSPEVKVRLTYNNAGNPTAHGYLDYISIEATRQLAFEGSQFMFKNNQVATTPGIVEYSLTNASAVSEIWDISNKYDVASVMNTEANALLSFKAISGIAKKYIAVTPSDYYEPLRDGKTTVNNQNIKGSIFKDGQGQFKDVDYLIVSPNNLVLQAERLAQINRDQNNLNVKVVTLDEIYTEFSSGNQDVAAIRNLVRYVYQNASVPEKRLKYLCLFGDASFDYKDRIPNNTNLVPSWHSVDSFSLTNAFVSDDFFGMMDDNEGDMAASNKLDIAVGRILAETPQRAKEMVDKIALYYKDTSYGSWRNNVVMVSDDVDVAWERVLQETTDQIGDTITAEKPFLNVVKIHSDAYQQQSSASGERYPDVNKSLKDAIEVGALVVNYFGHGGEDGLASERIFDKNDSQEIKNFCKFHCFVTVTCEYTRFDNPFRPTAGEYTYWNTQGGAIGLITTTRQIFVNVGVAFNVKLEKYLFGMGSADYPSMAEALRLTKNDPAISGIQQRRLVFFIGDPAMKLAFAQPNIQLTKINDKPLGQTNDTLKALSKVKMSGEVLDPSGQIMTNYNGILTATVFDKDIQRQTLANNNSTQDGQLIKMDFTTLGEKLFIGQATVTNGVFDFEFVVPRDIGVPVGRGKVSFYAQTETPLQDQAGANFDIMVGGINKNAAIDNTGPIVNLYMNDENFVSGGITNEAPTLLVKLADNNGINTASGIGHDIIAILDGDETNPFVLNDYYKAQVDDYTRGEVSYAFRDLKPGLHTLTLKAWDVYNNSSISEIQFVVHDKDQELKIENVLNYPNPFINYTEFWFNHNSSQPLDVSIQIFTISGKLVKTLNSQTNSGGCCNESASSLSRDIVWDGRDDFGDKIGKGVYVYKLKVRSNELNKQVEKIQKLVIL
ncbi:type IX secretion system sortase PorU [Gelidibacter salicanalis]|uniref:Type IX secretion system sortase PorU n=1 Tax=Gelidibacter salicanalis TaxID=291193 RepID=A0A934NKX6_9FLAO|nr:type IX secretion system sortase PorU [Gelidibacter salicanalis]MBJ7882887.1 type IX secretion system sortase PorU [Gelidibacter salicanalis]